MYAWAAIFALGGILGGSLVHVVDHHRYQDLKLDIAKANDKAQVALIEANRKVKENEENHRTANEQLEEKHNKILADNAHLGEQLSRARVQYNRNKAGHCTGLPKGDRTGISKETAATSDFSTRLNQLIDRNAAIADENTEYAIRAHQWAKSYQK